jgi:hypothetical protein
MSRLISGFLVDHFVHMKTVYLSSAENMTGTCLKLDVVFQGHSERWDVEDEAEFNNASPNPIHNDSHTLEQSISHEAYFTAATSQSPVSA